MRCSVSSRAAGVLFCSLVLGAAGELVCFMSGAAFAADPQPYDVTLKPTGNAALDGALRDSANLVSLQKTAPAGGFALVERARQDLARFTTAMNSYGYYKGQVTLTIAGKPLDDPTLADAIADAPADPPTKIEVAFDLGPQFHLGPIAIQGLPPGVPDQSGLTQGAPAMAADVLAAREHLLTVVREAGYPLAKVELPPATLHLDKNLLDVDFDVDSGKLANIGPITITGLQDMNESFVRQRLLLHSGERFSPVAIEKAREDLASVGVFSQVRMEPADHLDADGTLPVTVAVSERPLHSVDMSVGYSTDIGANFTTGWHHRNLFGNAEQLNLTAGMQLGGNATTKPGYLFGAQFIKPDFLVRDQSLELDLTALKQSLQAYDQTALIEKAAINRKFSRYWTGSLGILGEQESITQEGDTRHYNLIGLPATLKYDSTTSLLDPVEGIRATFSVTPTASLGSPSSTFFIMQASGSTYIDMTQNGRSVLALRGLVGKVSGAGVFGLPPDQRFYAGGSSTVRGFRYQSVGPRFPDNKPTGGTAIATGTVELRQRILDSYGIVAFVDAGQVTDEGSPFSSTWRIGAGLGARYYTPIGPIRLDVAVPINKEPGGDSFELYIGIGQAF
jgi:translocation and assembly module TamA